MRKPALVSLVSDDHDVGRPHQPRIEALGPAPLDADAQEAGLLEVDAAQLAVAQHHVGEAEPTGRPCGEAHPLDHAAGELEVVEVVAGDGHHVGVAQLADLVGVEVDVRVEDVGQARGLGGTRARSGSSGGHADIMTDPDGQAFAAA